MALSARSLLRASATSMVCMAGGDVLCQCFQQRHKPHTRIDTARVARFGLVGAALHGPFFQTGMHLLDRRFGSAQNLRTAVIKSGVGQLTMFPLYIGAFFMAMGSLEGLDLAASAQRLVDAFPTAAATGTLFWPVANLITFSLPPSRRVLFLGITGVAWNSGLSYLNDRAAAQ